MATDYALRKASKRERKRAARVTDDGRRIRKKNQPRRLCRGVCYQSPGLKAEDLEGEPAEAARALETAQAVERERDEATKRDRGAPAKAAQAEESEVAAKADVAASSAFAAFDPEIGAAMARLGYSVPMPVQKEAWLPLCEGRDVVAVAAPGAGKTVAYLLPAAMRVAEARADQDAAAPRACPVALVLVPTRELAQQVARDARAALRAKVGLLHGGVDKDEQVEQLLEKGVPEVLVATPGRLLDVAKDRAIKLAGTRYVVLDEADRMLAMGFAPALEALRRALSLGSPQVALFTATLPPEAKAAAQAWIKGLHASESAAAPEAAAAPALIRLGPADAGHVSPSVTQTVHVCAEHKKLGKLRKHLARVDAEAREAGARQLPRVVIFCNRIKTVAFLARELAGNDAEGAKRPTAVAALHGDLSQDERDASVAAFRSGKARILVATDIAARGLHVRNLPHVVNYDFPTTLEQYIHRIGRTGRVSEEGHAMSFFPRELAFLARPLVSLLEAHGAAVDPNLVRLAEAYDVVRAKLEAQGGAEAAEEGAAPPPSLRPDLNDVRAALGLKRVKRKKRAGEAEAEAKRESKDGEGEGDDASSPDESPKKRVKQAAAENAVEAPSEPLAFVASRKFRGARPGAVFRLGTQGLGYYRDAVQMRALGRKTVKAVGPSERADDDDADDADDDDAPSATQAGLSRKARRAKAAVQARPIGGRSAGDAPLPGLAWRRGKGVDAAAAGADSDDDRAPVAAAAKSDGKQKKKSLPGRLRKKLARDAARV